VVEGTTRLLETPEQQARFNQNVYEHPGSLAQATSSIHPQANQTRSLETKDKPRQGVLISSLVVAALLLTVLIIVLLNRTSTTTVSPPAVTRPEVPAIPPPPPPMAPPGITRGGTINPAFIYPGAQKTMELTSPAEGNMIQLQTSDSFDKVVNWYTEKLKPTSVVKQVKDQSQSMVLAGKEMTAIITANGAGTTIMLTQQGGD
jgi:hypothetical protein